MAAFTSADEAFEVESVPEEKGLVSDILISV